MCEFQTVISSIASFAELNMEKLFANKIHHWWPFLLLVTRKVSGKPRFPLPGSMWGLQLSRVSCIKFLSCV